MQPTPSVIRGEAKHHALPRDESGATIVEMAVVFGFFLLFVFGIIEFSWAFAEWNEVRHIAGECARNASVGRDPGDCSDAAMAVGAVCEISGIGPLTAGTTGQRGTVVVTKDYDGITGWFPLTNRRLEATHQFFLEEGVATGAGPC